MSLQHFKKLYEIAKTDGVKAALKYDAIETVKRHPVAVLNLVLLADSLLYEDRIIGYKRVDEEAIPPDKEGHALRIQGYEPVYARVPFWKANDKFDIF